jgi:ABC-type protease/lipase transport system fused ATPase/permease subunit
MGWLRQRDALAGLGMLPAVLRRWAPAHAMALERQDAVQRRAGALQALMRLVVFTQQVATAAAGAWLLTRSQSASACRCAPSSVAHNSCPRGAALQALA